MKRITKDKANLFLVKSANILEIIVGVILIAGILIAILPIISEVLGFYLSGGKNINFQHVLEQLLNIIIGVEFLKMLCRHNMDSVIEVLLFTLARKMIVEHSSALDSLLTIISISILFLIRKYLFVKQLDRHED